MAAATIQGLGAALMLDVSRYGYVALAAGVLLENAGIPVPGETMLLSAAALAARGRLSIVLVAAVAAAAAIAGDNVGFAIGRFGGRRVLTRFGAWMFVTPERLRAMDRFFAKRGPAAVFFARFIAGLRVVAALVAGSSEMPWGTFLLYNALGAVAWASIASAVGYAGGDLATLALPWIRTAHLGILAMVGSTVAVAIIHAVLEARHARAEGDARQRSRRVR